MNGADGREIRPTHRDRFKKGGTHAQPMSGKTAMITGVTGQDGSYLAELLLEKGYTVYGLVRRVSQPTSGRSLINHLMGNDNFHLLNGDLADQNSIDNAVNQTQPDEFYNLGAMSFVPESWRSPMMTADITGLGALRCLEAIRKHAPQCRFYQAGSSEQYGKVRDVPQTELTLPPSLTLRLRQGVRLRNHPATTVSPTTCSPARVSSSTTRAHGVASNSSPERSP